MNTTETKMTTDEALATATRIAGNDASVSIHHGDTSDAIRITGCTHDSGVTVAMRIAKVFHPQRRDLPDGWPGRHVTESAGFVAVWLD